MGDITVYSKKPNGEAVLLESGDKKRKKYLSVYNSIQNVRDRILNPDKFTAQIKQQNDFLEYNRKKLQQNHQFLLD